MADRRKLEALLRVVEQQMKDACVFTEKYKRLEKERARLLGQLKGRR
jgi:hypothetical protein